MGDVLLLYSLNIQEGCALIQMLCFYYKKVEVFSQLQHQNELVLLVQTAMR